MLEVKNLYKRYGQKLVLEDINLSFQPGRIYGIVGKKGAGKTTLFKCIAGIETYEGEIASPFNPLKNSLGYLETNPVIMSYITGWEYLKLMCSSKNILDENFEAQNIFNLPLSQYADTYSTGMKKKLALMGMLLRKNKILILDEPFNGVDIQSNMMITEIIQELKALGKTVIIASHIFSTLSETCDEIVLLSQGRILKNAGKAEYASLEASMKQDVLGSQDMRIDLE